MRSALIGLLVGASLLGGCSAGRSNSSCAGEACGRPPAGDAQLLLPPDQALADRALTDQLRLDAPPGDRGVPADHAFRVDRAPLVDGSARADLPAPSCVDRQQNGKETDVDCGGGTCPRCGEGRKCLVDRDCTTPLCRADSCAYPQSCAEQKSHYPQSGDGVYTLKSGAQFRQAYCDMQSGSELCSSVQGSHAGRTRDDAQLCYQMESVLDSDGKGCSLWGIRSLSDGRPLDRLYPVAGLSLSTCPALGFLEDLELGYCIYGSEASTCGFSGEFYRYSNYCPDCEQNGGSYSQYVLQGPIYYVDVLSNMSGSIRTRCVTSR